MKNFFYFLRGRRTVPQSGGVWPRLKLTALVLPAMFFVVLCSSLLQMLFLRWEFIDPVKSPGLIPDYMKTMSPFRIALEIAILAPLLEETAFRGPLQQHSGWLRTALFSLTYLIICRVAGLNFYEMNGLTIAALMIASLTLLLPRKTISTIIYHTNQAPYRGILIWCSAFAFGLWHYYNFDFSTAGLLTVVINLLPFFLNGLLLSYVAVKNGLLWSIILHMANNIWPLVLWL